MVKLYCIVLAITTHFYLVFYFDSAEGEYKGTGEGGISPKSKLAGEVEFLANNPVQKCGWLAEILTTGDTHYL